MFSCDYIFGNVLSLFGKVPIWGYIVGICIMGYQILPINADIYQRKYDCFLRYS